MLQDQEKEYVLLLEKIVPVHMEGAVVCTQIELFLYMNRVFVYTKSVFVHIYKNNIFMYMKRVFMYTERIAVRI